MKCVAEFTINSTQFLDAEGKLVDKLPTFANDTQVLIDLYRTMVLVRAYDNKAIALQRTGKMGTYASILGQEAISTAIGHAMQKEDVLVPFYRDYAAQLQRGVKMAEIYSYWGGDERGNHYADNQQDLPMSVPIASQCLHAAGVATAFKLRKQKRVAVGTCGDGATSQGDFYEALNVAGAWQLPLVVVINNNQWAISVPLSKQTKAQTLAQKAIAAGIHGEQVDGNDVIAVHHAMDKALAKARAGEGPSLIEALSYRLCDHTTADDATRYRSKAELENAWQLEPIKRLRHYLTTQQVWDETQEQQWQEQCKIRVSEEVAHYTAQTPQAFTSIFEHLYAHMPALLKLQRAKSQEQNHA